MELNYNKTALLEYMDEISSVGEVLKRTRDTGMTQYNGCKGYYSRLHTELEQACRKAYNMIESAESIQWAAKTEHALATRMLENAENDSDKATARQRLQHSNQLLVEAENEMTKATAEYSKTQANISKLNEAWEKYQLQLETVANRVEDSFSAFFATVSNGNHDLSEYMAIMDRAQIALYSESSGSQITSGESVGRNSIVNQSVDSAASGNSNESISESSLDIVSTAGVTSIVMRIAGKEYSFPKTKSGAAKAYRTALKSGDSEMINKTKGMFVNFETVHNAELPDNQQYVVDTMAKLQEGFSNTIDNEMVMAGAEIRKLRSPDTVTANGIVKGTWEGSVFFLDDDFVPPYKNEGNLTIGEIKQNLRDTMGIELNGIPYKNGIADFSSISIAGVSTKDIVMRSTGMSSHEYELLEPHERTEIFNKVFSESKRTSNFTIADHIAAERQMSIPGLPDGYTAEDVKKWRTNPSHHFTWDEQVNRGYNLVPTIIHGNMPHTGLVGSSSTASEYFERRKNDSPEKYSWDEASAPVSIDEVIKKP